MNLEQFREAVIEERLTRWVQVGRPEGTSASRVCIFEADSVWQFAITDERAGVIESTRRRFDDESTALEASLVAARKLKIVLS